MLLVFRSPPLHRWRTVRPQQLLCRRLASIDLGKLCGKFLEAQRDARILGLFVAPVCGRMCHPTLGLLAHGHSVFQSVKFQV